MPVTLVKDLIDRVSVTLQDRSNVRWSRADLLVYLNDAQKQIVIHRPDANAVNAAFNCVNASKQSLPAAGVRLLTVRRNIGGRAITPIQLDTLDASMPDWHQYQATDGVEHYIFDPIDPKHFYVFPVPAADHPIEIIYSANPTDITTEGVTVIGLDDTYSNVIVDYMLYRAYQKDATYGDVQRASLYLQAFNSALGIKTQVDSALQQRG